MESYEYASIITMSARMVPQTFPGLGSSSWVLEMRIATSMGQGCRPFPATVGKPSKIPRQQLHTSMQAASETCVDPEREVLVSGLSACTNPRGQPGSSFPLPQEGPRAHPQQDLHRGIIHGSEGVLPVLATRVPAVGAHGVEVQQAPGPQRPAHQHLVVPQPQGLDDRPLIRGEAILDAVGAADHDGSKAVGREDLQGARGGWGGVGLLTRRLTNDDWCGVASTRYSPHVPPTWEASSTVGLATAQRGA